MRLKRKGGFSRFRHQERTEYFPSGRDVRCHVASYDDERRSPKGFGAEEGFRRERLYSSRQQVSGSAYVGPRNHRCTTMLHNAHLSMLLKKRGFADRDAIPPGVWGSSERDQRSVERPAW